MNTVIPEISLISLQNQSEADLKILKEALNSHGFFTIIDHEIDDSLLDDSYTCAKEFFDLPEDVKKQYATPEIGGARGYTPFGKETALGENVADLKEFWHLGPEVNSDFDARIHKNIEVAELSNFNTHFNSLFTSLNHLGVKVLESIALVLDLPKDFFEEKVIRGNSTLRLLHYPPIESDKNVLRARAHADINLITLLVGAEEGGLEVQNKDDEWIPIKPNSKSIVCNIGDMMQLVTRSKLKSTSHRVIDRNIGRSTSRYSMPFFLHPSPEIDLCSIVDDSKESISANDFLEERLRAIKLY